MSPDLLNDLTMAAGPRTNRVIAVLEKHGLIATEAPHVADTTGQASAAGNQESIFKPEAESPEPPEAA